MPLVAFRCETCFHAGPIAAGPLARLATCSACGSKALVPGMRGKLCPPVGTATQPTQPPQPTEQMIEDGWAAYDGETKQCPRPRGRKTKGGKLVLTPRVMA